ncbi:MAG TPA: glycosyltransferase [Burkholderiales bacterium]|nr:glycosyltransferase [Burkholderiales bacterium]
MADTPGVTLSIVSHRHNRMISNLLGDLGRHCEGRISVVLTENVPDSVPISIEKLSFPVEKIVNARPKGFGANHNAAFARCHTPLFCVVNPDVRLESDPLPSLSKTLEDRRVGVAGPLVRNSGGALEDSARVFPTGTSLLLRAFGKGAGTVYPIDQGPLAVDWIAGMFMLFRRETYEEVGGFDEAYFLYYEDVDICWRLRAKGYSAIFDPRAEIVHDAQRASRGNLRLAAHHLASIFRYLRRIRG